MTTNRRRRRGLDPRSSAGRRSPLATPSLAPLWFGSLCATAASLGYALHDGRPGAAALAAVVGAGIAVVLRRVRRLVRDVEEQAVELLRLSGTDALTGLPNRRAWEESYGAVHRRCATAGGPVAVLMIDLDRFKSFNDSRGHLAGDRLLQDAVRAWQAVLRPGDLLARWGGEEFAACLPGCTADEALAVSGRLLAVVPEGQTASVGLAVCGPGDDPEAAVERADAALYAAKRGGRARTVVAPAVAGARPAVRIVLPEPAPLTADA